MRYLRAFLKIDSSTRRDLIVDSSCEYIRKAIGFYEKNWADLVERYLASYGLTWSDLYIDFLAPSKGASPAEGPEETEPVDTPPQHFIPDAGVYLKIDTAIRRLANSATSAGVALAVPKTIENVYSLVEAIELFADAYERRIARDESITQLTDISNLLRGSASVIAENLYSNLREARTIKTAVNIRNTRVKSVLDAIENPLKPASSLSSKVAAYLINDPRDFVHRPIKRRNDDDSSLDEWIETACNIWAAESGLVSSIEPDKVKYLNAVKKEWSRFVLYAINRTLSEDRASLERKFSQYQSDMKEKLRASDGNKVILTQLVSPQEKSYTPLRKRLNREHFESTLVTSHASSFNTKLSLHQILQDSFQIGAHSDAIRFTFALPSELSLNLESLQLKLSLSSRKFPLLGEHELIFGTLRGSGEKEQLSILIDGDTDESWLNELRKFLLVALEDIISNALGGQTNGN